MSIQTLPQPRNDNSRGIDRGRYTARHYFIWCSYAKKPCICAQFIKDGKGAEEFMDMNIGLWETMSIYLSEIFPGIRRQFMKYNLPDGLSHMSGAFMGCAVNLGDGDSLLETKSHRDVKERIFSVTWTKAHLLSTKKLWRNINVWRKFGTDIKVLSLSDALDM
jgi:hypothetical protein